MPGRRRGTDLSQVMMHGRPFCIFERSTCVMPINFTQKLVLYMSATARASVKHVPLRHALDRSLGVDDLTVRACNSGQARTTLVNTAEAV